MSEQGTARQEWPRLWPHQAAFIEQFFADPSKRGYLLQSDVGLGASSMATHLIQHATETIPNARILMLVAPKIFQVQMQHMLASLGVVADIVDRFRYRELQDAAPGQGTVWRGGTVSILSVAFAKQKDITCSLSAVSWTLLVVLEAHVLLGLQEQVVRQIVASSPDLRMVLITTTDVDGMPTFGMEPFTMTRWRRSQVVDHAGQRVFIQPLTDVEVIEFHEESGERRVREAVEEFAPLAGATDDATSLLRMLLLRSLASSPVALEERLRRFRNQLAHGTSSFVSAPGEEDDAIETMPRPSDGTENREKMLVAIDRCLAELESLSVDSKLNAFVNTLIAMRTDHNASGALCIVTAYQATLLYLQTQLEDMELTPYILHGAMSFDGRAHTIHEFEQRGGILLATTAMLTEGIALPHVASLIFYDLPPSTLMLQQVYGRFHRFGRTVPLTVHVLCDPNSIGSEFSLILNKLKALVTDNC